MNNIKSLCEVIAMAKLLNNIYYLSHLEGSLCYTYYTFLADRWYIVPLVGFN